MSDDHTPSFGESLYKFSRSVKLAIVLILFITFTSIIATLIPQKKDMQFYIDAYSRFGAWLIMTSGFDNFFKSFIFLSPLVVFFLNLFSCTFHRFTTGFTKKSKKRFGPDILHVGLLVMIIGGLVTVLGREEAFANLRVGDNIPIPGGYVMTLDDFEFIKYENGSPKDWISTVKVVKDEKVIHEAYPIEVNKPLKIGNVKLYQSSYNVESHLKVSNDEGKVYKLSLGQMIPKDNGGFLLKDVQKDKNNKDTYIAHFDYWENGEFNKKFSFVTGDKVDLYKIESMEYSMETGLQLVRDPGYYPILIGLLLLTLGLFITYIQKIGENKL